MSVEKTKKEDSQNRKKNNFLLIFVCVFLSVVLIFGCVFGIIAALNQSKKLVKFGSLGFDEGELNYLASYHKNDFMTILSDAGIKPFDTPIFWNREWMYAISRHFWDTATQNPLKCIFMSATKP